MKVFKWAPWLACLLPTIADAQQPAPPSTGKLAACPQCAEMNAEHEPFRVYGNTYYVGMAGISAILIASAEGHVLLDGGLPESAILIAKNITKLGFDPDDIKLIVTSHEHFDHVGGVAALQKATNAAVAASAMGAQALQQGGPTPEDPQFSADRESTAYPPVEKVRVVTDGESLRVSRLQEDGT